jgi:hypothetical protein
MKLSIFQSDKGDCLLLEGRSQNGKPGKLVLCDGGMGPSMRLHVRDELAKLRKRGRELEFIYVSHIDNDHISGVLQLLQDEVEWRVYDHHKRNGNGIAKPAAPRPPKIKGILHNAFRDLLKDNQRRVGATETALNIENLLRSLTPALFATADHELTHAAEELQAIATGVPEAIQVSKLIAADALDIPLNQPPGAAKPAQLLFVRRDSAPFDVGTMKFTLIGPTKDELENLRKGWNTWLRENQERVRDLRSELKRRIEEFSTGVTAASPFDLRGWNGIPDYKGVTAPNVASMMFMVEEDGKTLLLTGDGQQDYILKGLKQLGFLADDGHLHVNVLKMPHHGSEHNFDATIAAQLSADHYVFCANGEHDNPDLRVLDIVYQSRQKGPAATGKFNFWFSTTAAAQAEGTKKREYFEKVERHAKKLAEKSQGRLSLHFNTGAFIPLRI